MNGAVLFMQTPSGAYWSFLIVTILQRLQLRN